MIQALASITPLPGHAVFLLLIQLALLLIVARAGAETAKRVGLPAVVGELAAGIVLGPTVFGHYFPGAFTAIFPPHAEQFHLLETVGSLGMVLLLLLTGLETDLRLLKNLGRAALVASATGMLLPFAAGYGLGMFMPASYLAQPDHRMLFSAFLATAMAISAMPVIAKILMDLDLTRRDIGLVILSAGVVDDTAGWLILSVIAGAASSGAVRLAGLGWTLLAMAIYLAAMAFVVFPLTRLAMRLATRFRSPDADLVIIMVVTFLSAAATERIGVHAVFGAFVAGTVLCQVPQLNSETVHKLESFVFAVLAPVFFGIVGLKVNLWTLGGGSMLGIVLAVACLGKLIGCTIGGLWGGMRFWEAFSIAVAMNARGAMELVVASIGLSLGILNQQMFSIIVVVAIVTSFMAPLALRLTMKMVRMTDEEAKRILAEESIGAFDPAKMRVLLPTAGGPNALEAARIAFPLARRSDNPVDVVYIDAQSTWWQRVVRTFKRDPTGRGIDEHLAQLKQRAEGGPAPRVSHVAGGSVADTIVGEAAKGFDVLLLGASQRGPLLGGPVLAHVVENAPCHVAIVKAAEKPGAYKRVLVPIDGSTVARVAAEFAARYAESCGAELTLAVLTEHRPQAAAYADEESAVAPERRADSGRFGAPARGATSGSGRFASPIRGDTGRHASPDAIPSVASDAASRGGGAAAAAQLRPASIIPPAIEQTPEQEIERISRVFRVAEVKPNVVHLDYDPSSSAITNEVATGKYDLVIVGAENRAIQHKLFFGYETQRLIRHCPISVVIVVPHIGKLS